MDRTLQLVGRTSNEIFMLRYPRSVLNFCDYDLAYFAENAIAACNQAQKDGELDFDRVTDLRNSIKDAHVYIEHHLRTVYDKIVLDCWIDYICRRDNVGTATLWNRFIGCTTAFEKAVFVRLCDYRYNKAINEWLNLVRVQDYAKNKISFLFSKNLSGAEEAAARRNYFDLMFSVTARELGCRIEELGVIKVFSVGRLPSAPFVFPNISKDIVKNLLADFDYSEDYSDSENYGQLSDQIAMDAFSYMKHGLAQEFDSYNISRSAMENSPQKVYMPCGLKAAVDLEIDALIESGGWLARCKRCGRYFLRDKENNEEYCSLKNPGGLTCLQIYEQEHPRSRITPETERLCREITDEMYARVDRTMSLKEYESWKNYLDSLKSKVESGEIPAEELSEFIRYSSSMDLTRSNPVVEVPKREQVTTKERVVKPFMPERIQRSDIPVPKTQLEEEPDELEARREGFFTSPIVQRQKSERAQISHIIRAGDQRGSSAEQPPHNTFMAFGEAAPREEPLKPAEQPLYSGGFASFDSEPKREEPPKPAEQPLYSSRFAAFDSEPRREEPLYSGGFAAFDSEPRHEERPEIKPERQYGYDSVRESTDDSPAPAAGIGFENLFELFSDEPDGDPKPTYNVETAYEPAEQKSPARSEQRVVRKNAAAINAYGRMSGMPKTVFAEPEMTHSAAQETMSRDTAPAASPVIEDIEVSPVQAERDPFKNIGSIFDVLEQSENEMNGFRTVFEAAPEPPKPEPPKKEPVKKRDAEPAPEWEEASAEKEVSSPEKVTAENAPSGIWTEERNLFPQENEPTELDMLKERKRGRSSKTQRLFDAIMREPEDNPNFRRR